jgi:hypothetical protein
MSQIRAPKDHTDIALRNNAGWQSSSSYQLMKPKFSYDDVVRVRTSANTGLRPGAKAWVVGIFETRLGPYFDRFPEGIVYTIEFEDGSSIEIHEEDLEPSSP